MTDRIEIQPIGAFRAAVRPPGSKSITNRALVCAALAKGDSTLTGALDSEDTRVMIDSLRALGIALRHDRDRSSILVTGCNGRIPAEEAELYVANSGTTARFLTPLVALGNGRFTLDGTPRMRQRPIGDLLAALAQLGVKAVCPAGTDCPPVIVEAKGLAGGTATIKGDVSSQFLSGLLLAAPYSKSPTRLVVDGVLVSQPYVRMTLAVMRDFGVDVATTDAGGFEIPAGRGYIAREFAIEPDASAASYFFGAAAILGGEATVQGLSMQSLQGDVRFVDVLEQMGCEVRRSGDSITVIGKPLSGVDVDMNAISDTVQTLAAVALFAQGTTHIRGVGHIRHKETDRIGALATELRKLGANVDERDDGLSITPGTLRGATLDTYQDHRMAMSLTLVGLAQPGVVINDPGCTAKTYPGFFTDLARLRAGG